MSDNLEFIIGQGKLDSLFKPELFVGRVAELQQCWAMVHKVDRNQLGDGLGNARFREILQQTNIASSKRINRISRPPGGPRSL